MRKFKIAMFSVLCVALALVLGFGAFAAVYLSVNISGVIGYYTTDIGAMIWGTYAYNQNENTGTAQYLNLSGSGTITDNVYFIQGKEDSYTDIRSNIGTITFTDINDTVDIYVFIKNVGDRYIIPQVSSTSSDTTHIEITSTAYYFNLQNGNIDPLSKKQNSTSANGFINDIKTEISNGNCESFLSNSSINNEDVYVAKIVIGISNTVTNDGSFSLNASFIVRISFMADIQYTSNDILSVYQQQNQTSPGWTKFGYNSTLSTTPTKISSNSLSNLAFYLDEADALGNTAKTLSDVYSESAPVYKDIDIVNIDVATGELIGKLSDVNYNFEWYGRAITLPAGTTLLSGRTLTQSESFTVDVYTYYPTMYIRRWVVGNNQWISISDKQFTGAVKIKAYYTATFEATIFNPDKTVATNDNGIFTRSYVYDYGVLTANNVNYFQKYYGYGTYSGSTNATNQTQMLAWASNLTKQWKSSSLASEYKKVTTVQGENYTRYVYNLLYLVKYANNNSQAQVGYGNVYTSSSYSVSGTTVTTANGTVITTSDDYTYYCLEAQKGGGTIGVYNSSSKGSATYTETDGVYKLSATGFDNAGMNYGYNSTYTYGNDKQGLYANQFLTYNNGTKKYLTDGYVGSDGYTSVFCLGMCNAWGNVWTWVFGNAVISDGTKLYAYVCFDDYTYESPNYVVASNSNGYESNHKRLTETYNYSQMSYNLPTSDGYKTYLGTSNKLSSSGIESLVGLPAEDSVSTSSTTGLCDYYYCNLSTDSVFGALVGGGTGSSDNAGAFYFLVNYSISNTNADVGFRSSIIS